MAVRFCIRREIAVGRFMNTLDVTECLLSRKLSAPNARIPVKRFVVPSVYGYKGGVSCH